MTPQPSERDDESRNIAKRKQSGQSEEDFEPPQKKQKSLAVIEEQIEGVIWIRRLEKMPHLGK